MTEMKFEKFASLWAEVQDKHLVLIDSKSFSVSIFQSNNKSTERLFRVQLKGEYKFKYLKPYLLENLTVAVILRNQFTMSVDNSDLFDTFNHLGFTIYSVLNETSTIVDVEKAIIDGFQQYFHMFSKKKSNSLNTLVGFYGELLFLKQLIKEKGSEVILSWNGPDGNRHDFTFIDTSIEVKSCHKNYDSISIANEYQLLIDPPEVLFLKIFHFDVKQNARADTIKDLIHEIVEECETTEHRLIFISKINETGITFQENFSLDRPLQIDLLEEIIFIVDDSFPKITCNDLPDGISHVKYLVQLSAIPSTLSTDTKEIWKRIK